LSGKCLTNRANNPLTKIWIKNKETCVVYGMQQVVSEAGISELTSPIAFFSKAIMKEVNYG
jgi:chemotaxis response regulator CheB